jgi:hypothetical protein
MASLVAPRPLFSVPEQREQRRRSAREKGGRKSGARSSTYRGCFRPSHSPKSPSACSRRGVRCSGARLPEPSPRLLPGPFPAPLSTSPYSVPHRPHLAPCPVPPTSDASTGPWCAARHAYSHRGWKSRILPALL